jgi:hypothetical protein
MEETDEEESECDDFDIDFDIEGERVVRAVDLIAK